MHRIQITVPKRELHRDLISEHAPQFLEIAVPCETFDVGDSFVIDGFPPEKPEGFCNWAWVDIQRSVTAALLGAKLTPSCEFTCCTDGLRPVTFRIERIEDEPRGTQGERPTCRHCVTVLRTVDCAHSPTD